MFFIISKLLFFLEDPLIWVFILLLLALFLRKPKLRKRFLIAAVCVFYFFGNWFVNDEFMRWWEPNPTPMNQISKKHYDYAIVLGGALTYDSSNNLIGFHESTDRLMYALILYKKGVVDKILFSGGSGKLVDNDVKEADVAKGFFEDMGVPDSAIVEENKSRNTHENALFTKKILDKIAPHAKYLLITSAYHMRRSEACFEKVGLNCDTFPVDYYAGPRNFYPDHLFIPALESYNRWDILIHEWVGYIAYFFAGYV